MDNIEKYIKENRAQFDDQTPSDEVWSRISTSIPAKRDFSWLWKVAACLFFASTIYFALFKNQGPSKKALLAEKELVSEDFGDVESYYFEIISEKRELIYEYDSGEEPIEVDFEQDLQKLDAMYQVLKDELKANPSKKVVDALILNLLVRIDVLNEKIEELEGEEDLEETAPDGDVNI